jgi:hypothetical protein
MITNILVGAVLGALIGLWVGALVIMVTGGKEK